MFHAYRLVYPISEHAPPELWEYEQPYIDNLLVMPGRLIGGLFNGISRIGQR
jgi:hypothetical protein